MLGSMLACCVSACWSWATVAAILLVYLAAVSLSGPAAALAPYMIEPVLLVICVVLRLMRVLLSHQLSAC